MSIRQFAGLQQIATRAFNSLQVLRKEIESPNQSILSLGISNYNQVVPKDASQSKFGFFRSARLDNRSDNRYCDYNPQPEPHKQIARIYLPDDNVMHKSNTFITKQDPTIKGGYHWTVQIERGPIHRMPWSGWTFTQDPKSREHYKFNTLEEALAWTAEEGYGYILQYPKFRYTAKRKYADNFKWKGFPKDDPDS